eukprot:TRINITY_DN1760_c0_g1_i2.p2 TRINITY_DN1760_c0_g1~~TRINITY_DN1760_c0_g1_i2.p2  ORF type:complete len:155 (+),score=11.68 TRINITY_DN1760_c0_g1_i2:401-865(+)
MYQLYIFNHAASCSMLFCCQRILVLTAQYYTIHFTMWKKNTQASILQICRLELQKVEIDTEYLSGIRLGLKKLKNVFVVLWNFGQQLEKYEYSFVQQSRVVVEYWEKVEVLVDIFNQIFKKFVSLGIDKVQFNLFKRWKVKLLTRIWNMLEGTL